MDGRRKWLNQFLDLISGQGRDRRSHGSPAAISAPHVRSPGRARPALVTRVSFTTVFRTLLVFLCLKTSEASRGIEFMTCNDWVEGCNRKPDGDDSMDELGLVDMSALLLSSWVLQPAHVPMCLRTSVLSR